MRREVRILAELGGIVLEVGSRREAGGNEMGHVCHQYAPAPRSTRIGVLIRILKSRSNDQWLT